MVRARGDAAFTGAAHAGTTPEPHVTINYSGDRLLIERAVGKTTHVEHGRWPLRV